MGGTNPVAPYIKLDNTTQSFSAYKAGIDGNSVAAQRIAGQFAPQAQTSPNMTIMLDAGSLFDGTTLTEVAAQNTGTITAPMVHPRIDRVVIDNVTGTLSVIAGAEATSPVPGAIPSGKSPVARIALTTSTTSITNAEITDERNFSALSPGGFGALTNLSSASTCDIGSVISRNVKITGVTTITSLGSSASAMSPIYLVKFAGSLTLTNGSSLILIGGTDILTAAGDTAVFEYLGSGNWNMRAYARATGTPLIGGTVPTFQYLTSSGTYSTPAGCKAIFVRMVGPGGGGGSLSGGSGSSGSNTIFDTINAAGGSGGGNNSTGNGGTGGTGGSGSASLRLPGGGGGSSISFGGGMGGNSAFGGGANGHATNSGGTGASGGANTGGGGAGAASGASAGGGGGGGAGEYVECTITSPSSSYSVTVGTGGSGGAAGGAAGGDGGSGIVIVQEFY